MTLSRTLRRLIPYQSYRNTVGLTIRLPSDYPAISKYPHKPPSLQLHHSAHNSVLVQIHLYSHVLGQKGAMFLL